MLCNTATTYFSEQNKIKSGINKRKGLNNNNNNAQFENVSSEIIDDEIAALNPLNHMTSALRKAVERSNDLREKRMMKKNKITTIVVMLIGTIINTIGITHNKPITNLIIKKHTLRMQSESIGLNE